jgi:hypothetical protein
MMNVKVKNEISKNVEPRTNLLGYSSGKPAAAGKPRAGTHSRSPDTISSSAGRLVRGDFLGPAVARPQFCILHFDF